MKSSAYFATFAVAFICMIASDMLDNFGLSTSWLYITLLVIALVAILLWLYFVIKTRNEDLALIGDPKKNAGISSGCFSLICLYFFIDNLLDHEPNTFGYIRIALFGLLTVFFAIRAIRYYCLYKEENNNIEKK